MQPTPDFYNFDRYQVDESKTWQKALAATKDRAVLVVLNGASPEEVAFLQKILTAVSLDLERDCAVVDDAGTVLFKDCAACMDRLQTLLVFGRKPTDMGLHLSLPFYQRAPFRGVQLLFSDDLAAVAANQNNEKKQLWRQLQRLFPASAS